jgi:hypothetical protein
VRGERTARGAHLLNSQSASAASVAVTPTTLTNSPGEDVVAQRGPLLPCEKTGSIPASHHAAVHSA